MGKNIVICFDGGGEHFSKSNVRRMFSVLERCPQEQISYITSWQRKALSAESGKLGRAWSVMAGLAFGSGIVTSLTQAYRFLIEEYKPNDRLYLFGFSKGAFVAQALAALIHMFGLVSQGDEVLLEDTIRSYLAVRSKTFAIARDTRYLYGQACKPHFVGLWETPASTGMIYSPSTLPYTSLNPDITIGRHALAIDERRSMLRPSLWRKATETQDIREVWFAGAHSDVGGGYLESESGLAIIAFEWMAAEARAAGLLINQAKLDYVLNAAGEKRGDALSSLHNSLRGLWWIQEMVPARYLRPGPTPGQFRASFLVPFGRPRFIPEEAEIHESALDRMALSKYKPRNLPESYLRALTRSVPWTSTVLGEGNSRRVDAPASVTPKTAPPLITSGTEDAGAMEGASPPAQASRAPVRLKVFLCYVPGDEPSMRQLASKITLAGFDSWIASDRLQPGDDWKAMIPEMVRAVDVFLVCLSKAFNTNPDLAQKILRYALDVAEEKPEQSRFIIPVKFEDVAIPFKLQDWVPVNYYEQTGWDRLLSALNSHPARTL